MKKIGIVTFSRAFNYGAKLQEFALYLELKELGFDPYIIDYRNKNLDKNYYGLKSKIFYIIKFFRSPKKYFKQKEKNRKFKLIDKRMNHSGKVNKKNISKLKNEFDAFVCGSDQIWNMTLTGNDYNYFLDFCDNEKKISYAASFGKMNFSKEQWENALKKIETFNKPVLVREETGAKKIIELGIKDVKVVLDPSLLISKNKWTSYLENRLITGDYILLFFISSSQKCIDIAIEYSKKTGMPIYMISNGFRKIDNINKITGVGPLDFINLILYSSMIFTTSFHGVAFSTNLNKEFCFDVSDDVNNANSRITDLMKLLKIENRNVHPSDFDISKIEKINWDDVNEELVKQRHNSVKLLNDILLTKVNSN